MMVTRLELAAYQGPALDRGASHLYAPPHTALRPFISNYTVSFPTPVEMPDAYTVLPSASCTLVVSASDSGIASRLRGVNTQACNVGAHANKMRLLLLIEFRPGGLHPFLEVDQLELVDTSIGMALLSQPLTRSVETALEAAGSIGGLFDTLDSIFLSRLADREQNQAVTAMLRHIAARRGDVTLSELAGQFHYSPRQIGRLFARHVGVGPKMFSRIVRVNHAIQLLQGQYVRLADVAAQAGYFDQPHFLHDFRLICGLAPQEYMKKMTVFYNDRYKL